jgi:hypothetical protein
MKDKKCQCKGKCKCQSRDLILSQIKDAIRKLVKSSLEEMSGTGGVGAISTPYAFGKRGNEIATKSLPGFKVAKEIDESDEINRDSLMEFAKKLGIKIND